MKRKTMTENPIENRRESRSEYVANLELVDNVKSPADELNDTLMAIARFHNVKTKK